MMAGNRSHASSSKMSGDEINDLIFKLQALLPQLNQKFDSTVSASEILKEACSYIKKLERDVDHLSDRLWKQLDSMALDFESIVN